MIVLFLKVHLLLKTQVTYLLLGNILLFENSGHIPTFGEHTTFENSGHIPTFGEHTTSVNFFGDANTSYNFEEEEEIVTKIPDILTILTSFISKTNAFLEKCNSKYTIIYLSVDETSKLDISLGEKDCFSVRDYSRKII